MYQKELEAMMKAALDAEVWIKKVYAGDFEVETKSDNSPVTAADKGADKLIREELHAKFPSYALLTEESKDDLSRLKKDYLFIVDPVDGTKDFVSKDDEFCTNIALAYKGEVVVGLINIPMKNVFYYAIKGEGAYKQERGKEPVRIHVSDKTSDLTVFVSRNFCNEKEMAAIKENEGIISKVEPLGAALKFCYIAEGKGELSFRKSANTKEWDIASGDIILSEAGGIMLKPDGSRYSYNRVDVYNREGYILMNRRGNIIL